MALASLNENATASMIRRALATSVIATQPEPPSGITPRALCLRDGPVMLMRLPHYVIGTLYPDYQKGTCHICDHDSARPAHGHDAEGAMFQRRTRDAAALATQCKEVRTTPSIRMALATSAITTQPDPPSGMTPRALCFRDGPVMLQHMPHNV